MSTAIRPVIAADLAELVRMRNALWPEGGDKHPEYARHRIAGAPDSPFLADFPSAVWVAQRSEGGLGGFVEVGIRSHAEGCYEGLPIAFIEGWWVDPDLRTRGVGRTLMDAAERWAKDRGCCEIGATALLSNVEAQRAHLAVGFAEEVRTVSFRKDL
ncbi:MAG: GNAT family N-acetyltransferase [Myxococcota bacterium]